MLEELHVRDLALIDEAWLELGPGLTVLTGETGAGKTVLVGALKLLLGERGDSGLVRSGASEALVEGRFAVDGEILARRRLSAEGRSRCTLDGEMATVGELAERLGPVVDLHGQHEHQALLHPSHHASYLDRFAGAKAAEACRAYRGAYERAREAADELERLSASLADRERRADYLRFQIADIDAVAPKAGEDEDLGMQLPILRHGEKLAHASATAFHALHDEGGASDRCREALGALSPVLGIDAALDLLAERLSSAMAELDDVGVGLRDYGEGVGHDPRALNTAEDRLAALQALKKKYGPMLGDVLSAREMAVMELETLDAGEDGLRRAQEALDAADEALRLAGERLTEARAEAVPRFAAALAETLAELAMPSARFDVTIEPLPFERWTADGPHRVEFTFSSNAGEPARPLAKVASGGEVSRVMLALKSALGAADSVPVLVFDEVDVGIGGATALAVGRLLRELASQHQVLVVTHLAQVAAFADRHLVVAKAEVDGRTVTRVAPVEGAARVAEVARMLSGSDSATSLAHAEELLSAATA